MAEALVECHLHVLWPTMTAVVVMVAADGWRFERRSLRVSLGNTAAPPPPCLSCGSLDSLSLLEPAFVQVQSVVPCSWKSMACCRDELVGYIPLSYPESDHNTRTEPVRVW